MTDKTWTTVDVAMGVLKVSRKGSQLHLERRYVFLDSTGAVLSQVAGGRVVEDIELVDLPPGFLSALAVIDEWTKNKALVQEGMDE